MNTVIESLGVYLPPRVVSTQEVLGGCRRPVRFPLEKLTGIRSRRMAGEREFAFDLAREAALDCLRRSRRRAEDIDLLVSCSISRCDGPSRITIEPGTASRLAAALGLSRARAFDLSNACTGMFTGIHVADAYLKLGLARCAMVVSGEYITYLTELAQPAIEGFMDPRLACLTLGDAGAALLLEISADDGVGFHAIDMFTLGRYSSYCVAKASGGGTPMMYTDSVKITEIAVLPAVASTAETFARSGSPLRSIEHLVLHQTSRTTLRDAARVINQLFPGVADETSTVDNLGERGNTASTSHFVAVMDHVRSGRIQAGDNAVFGISGSGQTLGTALYTFDDLPDRLRRAGPDGAVSVTEPPRLPAAAGPRIRIESVGTATRGARGRTTIELCREAALACLGGSAHGRGEIDLLVHAGVYRTEFVYEPALAAMVAGDLGINDVFEPGAARRTFAFDVGNGGVGFLDACHVAAQMIRAGKFRTAMVLASEVEPGGPDGGARAGVAEAASAVILEASGPAISGGFGAFHFRRFPAHVEARSSSVSWETGMARLHVARGADLEERFAECAREAVAELLQGERIDMCRVAAVLPPQISPAFVARIARALGVPAARCADVADDAGDLFTSSLGYALQDVHARALAGPGDVALMVSVGAGIQIGCALYYF